MILNFDISMPVSNFYPRSTILQIRYSNPQPMGLRSLELGTQKDLRHTLTRQNGPRTSYTKMLHYLKIQICTGRVGR